MSQNTQRIISLGLDLGHEDCVFCISYDFQAASLYQQQKQQQQSENASQRDTGVSDIDDIPAYIDPGVFKIPAYLAFTDSGIKVGQEAKDLQHEYRQNTVFYFKRLLFVRYSDKFFQSQILPFLPFEIEQGPNDSLLISIVYQQQLLKLSPVDLFKIYLHHTLIRVAQSLQVNVDLFEIVATVPSTYDTLQIQSLINACTINEREVGDILTIYSGLVRSRSTENLSNLQQQQQMMMELDQTQLQQLQSFNKIKIATNVLRVIKESNAMALGYYQIQQQLQLNQQAQQQQQQPNAQNNESEKNVIVYRVGWDSLDVTLVSISGEMIEIKAISGNNLIGGEEFLVRLIQLCILEFNNQTGIDLSNDKITFNKLIWPCKLALNSLNTQEFYNLRLNNFYGSYDLNINLSRQQLEQVTQDLIQICVQPMAQLLKETQLHINQVNDIMLLGSFSNSFQIRNVVSLMFNGRQVFTPDNPSILGAIGAYLEARSLSSSQEIFQNIHNLLMVDVIPLSLGVEIEDGRFHAIVHKSASFPLSKSMFFTPQHLDHETLSIKIYEGLNEQIHQNTYLGQIKFRLSQFQGSNRQNPNNQQQISNLSSSGSQKAPKIEIRFDIDSNKLLKVTVQECGTQNKLICKLDKQWIRHINFMDQSYLQQAPNLIDLTASQQSQNLGSDMQQQQPMGMMGLSGQGNQGFSGQQQNFFNQDPLLQQQMFMQNKTQGSNLFQKPQQQQLQQQQQQQQFFQNQQFPQQQQQFSQQQQTPQQFQNMMNMMGGGNQNDMYAQKIVSKTVTTTTTTTTSGIKVFRKQPPQNQPMRDDLE